MATLRVELVAADRAIWTGEAKMVVAKTVEGEIGLLPGHEPMLAILASGEVRITLEDGAGIKASAEDGFLSIEHDVVTIVARHAELFERLDAMPGLPAPIVPISVGRIRKETFTELNGQRILNTQ